ncbi:MAG: peptidoglycan editing factor PgeF [Planctomycetota bacterium]
MSPTTFDLVLVNERRYAQFAGLRLPGLVHAFSTRPMTVAPRNGDDAEARAANRTRFVSDWGLEPQRLCWCQQVHEPRLALVTKPGCTGSLQGCDGAVTNLPSVPLMAFSADCPLLLLFDCVRRVVAVVHASWRCTVAQLGRRMIELMACEFGSSPADLHAGIGPGAGPCCYEVQADVYDAAAELSGRDALFPRRDGRMYFDLWAANRVQLAAAGVQEGNIEIAGVCTLCRNDLFYSWRREGAGCGHFGLLAALT